MNAECKLIGASEKKLFSMICLYFKPTALVAHDHRIIGILVFFIKFRLENSFCIRVAMYPWISKQ